MFRFKNEFSYLNSFMQQAVPCSNVPNVPCVFEGREVGQGVPVYNVHVTVRKRIISKMCSNILPKRDSSCYSVLL